MYTKVDIKIRKSECLAQHPVATFPALETKIFFNMSRKSKTKLTTAFC